MINSVKPRIYIAISTFLPYVGGAEYQALAQGRMLRQRGYEATIVTLRHHKMWPASEEIDGVPVLRVAGNLLADRERFFTPVRKLAYVSGMIALGWNLWQRRHKYDILHVYQLNMIALPAAIVCLLAKKPLAIAVRNAEPVQTGASMQGTQAAASRHSTHTPWHHNRQISPLGGDLADLWRLGGVAARATRMLLRRVPATLIVLSTRMRHYVDDYHFEMPDTRLIANGVDIVRFNPKPPGETLDAQIPTVICVARLSKQKGIDVLLRAWHMVASESPDARLLLVGAGPELDSLGRLATELQITDSVRFAGLQQDILSLLHKATVAVLPSRSEGMPNALLEAMACGLPCVATRVSGSEDIILDGANGLLVEPENAGDLAAALLVFLRDPAYREKCGRAARATMEQNYSVERISRQYLGLYQELYRK